MNSLKHYNNKGVKIDWYDASSGEVPKHNQKNKESGYYWNEFVGRWCIKKSKKQLLVDSKLMLYDFTHYGLVRIAEDFGYDQKESVGLFLTMQYQKQVGRGFKAEDWGFIYWSVEELRRYLGYQYQEIISLLRSKRIIKVDRKNSKVRGDRRHWMITLDQKFKQKDERNYDVVALKDQKLERSIADYYQSILDQRDSGLKYIEGVLDSSSLIIDDLDKVLEQMWIRKLAKTKAELDNEFIGKKIKKEIIKKQADLDVYKINYKRDLKRYYDYIVQVQQTDLIEQKRVLYSLVKSDYGSRISHMYSNAPKIYRRYLKIDGEEVAEVDIVASQPSFLCVLFERGDRMQRTKEMFNLDNQSYLNMMLGLSTIKGLDIYRYMAVKLRGEDHANNDDSRSDMKSLFYKLIFGNPEYSINSKLSRKEVCTKIFGTEFYQFILELSKKDLGYGIRKDKNLSFLLQRTESKFISIVTDRLIKEDIKYLPLYDSLIIKKSQAQRVKSIFIDVINEQGLAHILRVK